MSRTKLTAAVAAKTGLTKRYAAAATTAAIGAITDALAAGEKVKLKDFGTFVVKDRAPRTGNNPGTGETVAIPATKAPAFRPGKTLRDAVSK